MNESNWWGFVYGVATILLIEIAGGCLIAYLLHRWKHDEPTTEHVPFAELTRNPNEEP